MSSVSLTPVVPKPAHSGAKALPKLRQDLALYDGPSNAVGAPTWSLHDPVRNLYFKLDWATFEIISRWSLGASNKIVRDINQTTALKLSEVDVENVCDFLVKSELIEVKQQAQVATLEKAKGMRQTHWIKKLLHVYLFFRVPLLKPDLFLTKHLPKVQWLASRWFTLLSAFVAVFGLWEISRQWGSYQATLVDMLNPSGLLYYGATLACLKVAHEFGHAFVAKHHGCHVPRMGLAFLVFFPVAYTDVNDAWRLSSHKARVQIGAAGIRVELTLAVWSSLLWAMLPDGHLRTAAYLVSSTTWISTLLINASPFMRFDGYFIFMDYIKLPNLHQRSFAMGRWFIGQHLLGLALPKPEHLISSAERFLVGFAFGTWLYRFILFSGIAWMVYTAIPKPLGPFLAAVEWWWFIIKPVYFHTKAWALQLSQSVAQKENLTNRKLSWVVGAVGGFLALPRLTRWFIIGLLLIAILPWSSHLHTEGLMKPRVVKQYQLPQPALVADFPSGQGRRMVNQGELLASFQSEAVELEATQLDMKLRQLEHQIQEASLADKNPEKLSILLAERREIQAQLLAVSRQTESLRWVADKAGFMFTVDPDLKAGDWASKGKPLIALFDSASPEISAYVHVDQLARLSAGNVGTFYPDADFISPFAITVVSITEDSMANLDDPLLSTEEGGRLSARVSGKVYAPDRATYKVVLHAESVPKGWRPDVKVTGRVVIAGESQSFVSSYLRAAFAFIQREAGL